jgi:excisionase family DNA binding protein
MPRPRPIGSPSSVVPKRLLGISGERPVRTPERECLERVCAALMAYLGPESVLALLGSAGSVPSSAWQTPAERAVDYSVAEVAGQFKMSRSTVREWCQQGRFPGAYRRREREWRIPREAVVRMQEAERTAHEAKTSDTGRLQPKAVPAETKLELGSWRRVRPA